jgi:homocysteine S-methyltransferase
MIEAARETPPNPILPFLERQRVLIVDGGLATELERRGADLGDELWSARLLADAPELIRAVHLDYLAAGADCIVAASYQATVDGFVGRGRSRDEARELLLDAVRIARAARDDFWADERHRAGRLRPLVAASIGPYGAALADGSEYTGAYDRDEEALIAFHRERFALLAGSGADLLACETIPSLVEGRALARLIAGLNRENPGVWAWLSFACRDGERLADGSDLAALVAELTGTPGLAAIGINCTAPRFVSSLVARARAETNLPIVVYPNSGEAWDAGARRWVPADDPIDFAASSRDWLVLGATLIGGCCRTGPREIAAIRRTLVGDRS